MTQADRIRWDERYALATPVAPGLPGWAVPFESLFPNGGRAVDLACGLGSTALWLGCRGLVVDVVDVSGTALEALAEAAVAAGCSSRIRTHRWDLDDGNPIEGPFDVAVCTMFRAPTLVRSLANALNPGGLLIASCRSEVRGSSGVPGRFMAEPGELLEAVSGLTVVHHHEGDGVSTVVAQLRSEHRSSTEGT